MDSLGTRLKKTAEDVAEAIGDAAVTARERLNEMAEINRLNGLMRKRQKERDACKITMADLLIRMFDQNTFADALLRPEYTRIKEIDEELKGLQAEKEQVMAARPARSADAPAAEPTVEPSYAEQAVDPAPQAPPADLPPGE